MFTIYSSVKGNGSIVYHDINKAIEAAKEVAKRFGGYTQIVRHH